MSARPVTTTTAMRIQSDILVHSYVRLRRYSSRMDTLVRHMLTLKKRAVSQAA